MSVTVVVGGQYGSEGKGKMISHLSRMDNPAAVVRCGGPNAGHTVFIDSEPYALRQLPAGVVNPDTLLCIAAGAVIDPVVLRSELDRHGAHDRLMIDPNAVIVEEYDRQTEMRLRLGEDISSTLSGTGAATSRKVMRSKDVRRAEDLDGLRPYIGPVSAKLNELHDAGGLVLVEGTQGFALSLHHGHNYPFVTSRDTTASAFLSDAGLSPLTVNEIVMVVRTHPIRVAGNSGPLPRETSWAKIRETSHYPNDVCEFTTVTGRVRRVAKFDIEIVRRAVQTNRPTSLAVHGLDYITYDDFGLREFDKLSALSGLFISKLEIQTGVPVSFVFTGPPDECVIDRRCRAHAISELPNKFVAPRLRTG